MNIARNFGGPEVVAHDEHQLEEILKERDSRGGAQFWLSDTSEGFPCLLIVVSGDWSFVIYLPEDGHPGFRCLLPDDDQSTTDSSTNFVWEGCDPFSGELVPNRFVIPFSASLSAAQAFYADRSLPDDFLWFEL